MSLDHTLRQDESEQEDSRKRSEAPAPAVAAEAPLIPGYVLTRKLGAGSFGEVWAALQSRTGQQVAVKIYINPAGLDWGYLEQEVARLVRVAEHPHVVTLLDADLAHSPPYFVMRLQEQSLTGWLESSGPEDAARRRNWRRVLTWFDEVAQALNYTHLKGLIHCDLKPSNVLLDSQGRAQLADFGQSVARGAASSHLGSLGTMPPEQAGLLEAQSSAQPDVRWDIYALGATIYYLWTGSMPRLSSHDRKALSQLTGTQSKLVRYRELLGESHLVPIRSLNPAVDSEVAALVESCLALSPERRPQSAAAVVEDLRRYREKRPLNCRRPWSMGYRAERFLRRRGVESALVGLLAVSALGYGHHSLDKARVFRARQELEQGWALQREGRVGEAMLWWARAYQTRPQEASPPRLLADFAQPLRNLWQVCPEALNLVQIGPDGRLLVASETGAWWRRPDDPKADFARIGSDQARHLPGLRSDPYHDQPPSAGLSADGRVLFRIGQAVELLDLSTGQVRARLEGPGPVLECFLNDDGSRALLQGGDYFQLYDTGSGQVLAQGKDLAVASAALSPSGDRYAIGLTDGHTRLVSVADGKSQDLPVDYRTRVLLFSPDSQLLLVSGENEGILWDVAAARVRQHLVHGPWPVFSAAFSPRGSVPRLATAGYNGVVRIYDPELDTAGRQVTASSAVFRHRWLVYGVTFNARGDRLASYSIDGTARVWDLTTNQACSPFFEHKSPVKTACLTSGSDGASERLITGCEDGTCRIFEVPRNGLPTVRLGESGPARVVAAQYFAQGSRVVVAGQVGEGHNRTGEVRWFETEGLKWLSTRVLPSPVACLAVSPNSSWIAAGCESGCLQVWSTDRGIPAGALQQFPGPIESIAFSPDSSTLAVACSDGKIRMLEVPAQQVTRLLDAPHEADGASSPTYSVQFSPDGRLLAAAGSLEATLYDTGSGRATHHLRHQALVRRAVFSPDGHYVATASFDNTARFWAADSGQPVGAPMQHSLGITDVTFSPDGHRLASSSADSTARVWSCPQGQPVSPPLSHRGPVWRSRFSPDGHYLLTAGKYGQALLFCLPSGCLSLVPVEHSEFIYDINFRPDGRQFLTGSWDGSVQFRDLPELAPVSAQVLRERVERWTGLQLTIDDGVANLRALSPQGWSRGQAAPTSAAKP